VLCLPIIEWGFRFQRPQQLLSRFAEDGHRVFYARTGFLGLDREPEVRELRPRVFEVALPGEHDFEIYSRTLAGETLSQAVEAIAELGRRHRWTADTIIFVEYPSWEPLARELRERFGWRLVYDCMDEHTGFGTHGVDTAADERRLISESDLVAATSRPLLEKVRRIRPDVLALPNGGDAARFEALPARSASPLSRLPRPVIGYYGAIAAWFDVASVAEASRRHPEWSVALVGDASGASLEALEGRPNVHRYGEVPYDALAAYVAGFDVCTIPFERTPLTEATNPVKLYEYLATGKPVVARRLPEIEPFENVVLLYGAGEDFATALEAAVREDPASGLAVRRRALARENTWEMRYRDLKGAIAKIPVRSSPPSTQSSSSAGERGGDVAARVREIRRLDGIVREQKEGIEFLRGEVAVRERVLAERVAAYQREIERLEKEIEREQGISEAREKHLETALAELERWETSRLGRLRHRLGRVRHGFGRATAPGTPLFAVGSKLMPRPLARWLRRVVAPVKSEALVELPGSADSVERRRTDALPMEPAGRYDTIVFSIIDFDFRFQRPQQLATQFGRHGHRVFYLSTTKFLSPGGPAWDLARKADRVAELKIRSRRSLNVYSGHLDAADVDVLAESFEALAADLAIGDAVCLVQIPFWAPLAYRLRERLGWKVVYDCMDEWTNFPGFGQSVLSLEEKLVRAADATIVSADRLEEKWKGTAPRLVLARNAMDAEHYRARFGPNTLLSGAPHPIIGYYGALASWVDVKLLTKIVDRYPNGTVVLAGGRFDVDLSPIEKRANVRLLGQRPYEEMPQLLWNFDACMIPFLVNDITEATNPVKFYEYLWGEKPVVAPALTELLPYESLSYLARGHEEFLEQLDRAVAEPADDPRRAARRRTAEENDWAHRYEAIADGIGAAYPVISVVIVTYGGLELTKACLESLLERETWPRLDVIVVDNASSDGTPEYLTEVARRDPRVRCVLNRENRGFAAANNQGIAVSAGDIVVLLNNDTVVPPGLMGRLAEHLRRDATIGLLCPTTNFCGNEARVEPDYTDLADLPAYAARRAREFRGRAFDIGVAAMYCVAARRAVLDEVGPLDEAYGVGMFEDDDFAVRMRAKGYRVACAEDAYVHHVGQGAFRKLSPEAYDALWKKNQAYFEKKFGVAWKAHAPRDGVAAVESKIGT
jgi:GT2 family glycosyltransferase/glycosyltransferase involved in cell wall biosynthesis